MQIFILMAHISIEAKLLIGDIFKRKHWTVNWKCQDFLICNSHFVLNGKKQSNGNKVRTENKNIHNYISPSRMNVLCHVSAFSWVLTSFPNLNWYRQMNITFSYLWKHISVKNFFIDVFFRGNEKECERKE